MPLLTPTILLRLTLLASLSLTYGCHNRSDRSSASQSTDVPVTTDTLCFRQVLARDTTTLRLVIHDTRVDGFLDINPYEKDRARGAIHGIVSGNQIQANWDRNGEGMTQRYALLFTLKADAITWNEGERIEKQGTWVLKEPDKGYAYVLTKIDCP